MKTNLVIWDFNGTIINDLPLSLKSINTVLKKRSLPIIVSNEAYREAFRFPIIKYYESLGLNFSREPYKIPADEWVSLYNTGITSIPLTDGIIEILETIRKMNIPQIILSASESKMLYYQLEHYGITEYFDEILGCDNVYGGGKIEIAKKWKKEKNISFENAVYIGDTDHDHLTAETLGCKCILYAGGHMSKKRLNKLPSPVVDNIRDVLLYMN